MYKLLFLGALPAVTLAAVSYPPLVARADVVPCDEQGLKTCGSTCIQKDYTCCPDQAGGCPTETTYCSLGDNNEYGCCPIGETCGGDGGATTSSSEITITVTSTESSVIPITESSTGTYSTIASAESSAAPSEYPSVSTSCLSSSSLPVSTPYAESTQEYTTSTIYSTTCRTVTSASSTVVYTDVIPVSTTVCTVSKPAPTYGYSTSTIYATSIYMTTSCAPEVAYCPSSSTVEVTDVYAVSTTVCPVTESPYPTYPVNTHTEAAYYPVTTQPTTLYPTANTATYQTYTAKSSQYPVVAGASGIAPTALKVFGAVLVAALAAL